MQVRICFLCNYEKNIDDKFKMFTDVFKLCKLTLPDLHNLKSLVGTDQVNDPEAKLKTGGSSVAEYGPGPCTSTTNSTTTLTLTHADSGHTTAASTTAAPYVPVVPGKRSCWSWSASKCLNEIARIQHCLPMRELATAEKDLLWQHCDNLLWHNRWLVQLIRAVSGNDTKTEGLCAMLAAGCPAEQRPPCARTLCSSHTQCQPRLTPENGLELLAGIPTITDGRLRGLAVDALETATQEQLVCFVPLLVSAMKDEANMAHSKLFLFLSKNCDSPELRHVLYWSLTRNIDVSYKGKQYARCVDRFKLGMSSEVEFVRELIQGHELVDILSSLTEADASNAKIKSEVMKVVDSVNRESLGNGLAHPAKPDFHVKAVENVWRESSAMAPVVVRNP